MYKCQLNIFCQYENPTEAMSASQMSKRSLPDMSYMDFSSKSMPVEFVGDWLVSMFITFEDYNSNELSLVYYCGCIRSVFFRQIHSNVARIVL